VLGSSFTAYLHTVHVFEEGEPVVARGCDQERGGRGQDNTAGGKEAVARRDERREHRFVEEGVAHPFGHDHVNLREGNRGFHL